MTPGFCFVAPLRSVPAGTSYTYSLAFISVQRLQFGNSLLSLFGIDLQQSPRTAPSASSDYHLNVGGLPRSSLPLFLSSFMLLHRLEPRRLNPDRRSFRKEFLALQLRDFAKMFDRRCARDCSVARCRARHYRRGSLLDGGQVFAERTTSAAPSDSASCSRWQA